MKQASSGLISLLATKKELIFADLWTFTLKNGTVLRYTNWDTNLKVGGNTFASHDVILVGGKIKQTRGLEVNETDLTCYPNLLGTPSLVGSIPFLKACVTGLLDRATAQRERIFMPTPGDVSLGTVRIFLGEITEIDVTRNTAILKCKDATNLLNIYMPRRQYQPTCPWTFGDSNCTFNKSSLTVTSSVGAGSNGVTLLSALAQVDGYFNFGAVMMISGLNNNVSRAIKSYQTGVVTLTGAFPQPLSPGDTFNITPGCSKNLNGQVQIFNGSAVTGNTPSIILASMGTAAGTYNGLLLVFTDGALNGQSQIIASWSPNQAIMAAPFTAEPGYLDNFIIKNGNKTVATGNVVTALTSTVIPVGLTNASGFFNGGTLQFTSGANIGQVQTISSWSNGIATVASAFSNTPVVGDECALTSVTSATQGTCNGYANNINFGGEPFVPIPETAY